MFTIGHTAITLQLKVLLDDAERCQEAGQLDKAATLCDSALELADQKCGVADVQAPGILMGLGLLLQRMGRLQEAHRVCVQAIELAEEALGTDHAQLAIVYHNLADLELVRGRFVAGESYARRSVEILELELERDHIQVARGIDLLAALLDHQGRHAESRPLYHRILPLFEAHYGLAHELSAGCRERLRNVEAVLAAEGAILAGDEP